MAADVAPGAASIRQDAGAGSVTARRRPVKLMAHNRYATPLPPDSARRDFMAVGLAIVLLLLLGFMAAVAPGPW